MTASALNLHQSNNCYDSVFIKPMKISMQNYSAAICLALLCSCANQQMADSKTSPETQPVEKANDQMASSFSTIGKITVYDSTVTTIIDSQAKIEQLAEGYGWSEGPLWLPAQQALLFNDVPGNTMYRWSKQTGAEVFLQPAGLAEPDSAGIFREPGANGIAAEDAENVLVADHGLRAVVRLHLASKKKTILSDRYQGKRFNSPNDLVRRSDGVIFFTDPPYGLKDLNQSPAKEQPHNGVYRRDIDGSVVLLDDSLSFPNGIALSPDQKNLYVANSDPQKPIWMRYLLDEAGNVVEKSVFADASDLAAAGDKGLPDGLKVAKTGEIFATGPGGVLIFSTEGKRLGRIETGTAIANCAFGDDGSVLYMTSHQMLTRVRTQVRGW